MFRLARFALSPKGCQIKLVTVIGGGTMGPQIAQAAATHGCKVTMVDINEKLLKKSHKEIHKITKKMAKRKFKEDRSKGIEYMHEIMDKVFTDTSILNSIHDSDLVIEAITENLEAKQDLFNMIHELDICGEDCVYVSNTSSLCIKEISDAIDDDKKERFAGLKFYNPVALTPNVEVITIEDQTSEDTKMKLTNFCQRLEKHPIYKTTGDDE